MMEMTLPQSTEHELSEMLGSFLRRRTQSAKDLARLIDCDPRTAEGFRAGRHWPTAKHWKLIIRTFKRDVIAAVFEPQIDAELARLRLEERQLEERLEEIRRHRREAHGDLDSDRQRLEAHQDREPLGPPNYDLFDGDAR